MKFSNEQEVINIVQNFMRKSNKKMFHLATQRTQRKRATNFLNSVI